MISTVVTAEEQKAHPMLLSQKIILFELHPVCIIIFEVELNEVTYKTKSFEDYRGRQEGSC